MAYQVFQLLIQLLEGAGRRARCGFEYFDLKQAAAHNDQAADSTGNRKPGGVEHEIGPSPKWHCDGYRQAPTQQDAAQLLLHRVFFVRRCDGWQLALSANRRADKVHCCESHDEARRSRCHAIRVCIKVREPRVAIK